MHHVVACIAKRIVEHKKKANKNNKKAIELVQQWMVICTQNIYPQNIVPDTRDIVKYIFYTM